MNARIARSSLRRACAGLVALASAALLAIGGTAPVMAAPAGVPADALPAVFASGGTGRFTDQIQWLQWADYSQFAGQSKPNVPILDYGQSRTFTNYRDMGSAGSLVTTCSLSNLEHLAWNNSIIPQWQAKGPLVATIPGTWAGDVLDDMYNIGGSGTWSDGSAVRSGSMTYPQDYTNRNQMVIGLANGYAYNGNKGWDGRHHSDLAWDPTIDTRPTGGYSRVSFDVSCSAELISPEGGRLPVALDGLVFADAEASSVFNDFDEYEREWIQASVPDGTAVSWRVLDGARSQDCPNAQWATTDPVTTRAHLANGGRTMRLQNTGEECVYQNGGDFTAPNGIGGPATVMLMGGATSARITLQGAGYSAVALGLVIATDFGDAPQSYGVAASLFQPQWEGGMVTADGQDLWGLVGTASMGGASTTLGERIDAESAQTHSIGADADDTTGPSGQEDDEDGVVLPAGGIVTAPGQTVEQQVTCRGQGEVAGWIDFNHNGTFDEAERSAPTGCPETGTTTLSWVVPDDVVRSVDGEEGSKPDTYMRVRISDSGEELGPTGVTTSGEVEDYKVSVRVPTLELVKQVEAPYASGSLAALEADQWTLTAQRGIATAAPDRITGAGRTPISTVRLGSYVLSESSTNPLAEGYEQSGWLCTQTPGTVNAPGARPFVASFNPTLFIRDAHRITCTVTNASKPAELTWQKVDEDGTTPLGGSAWTLSSPALEEDLVITDCQAEPCGPENAWGIDVDPAPGSFTVRELTWGAYTMTEHTAPEGYRPVEDTFCFEIAAPAGASLDPTEINEACASAEGTGSLSATVLDSDSSQGGRITNTRYSGSVSWTKTDEGGAALGGSAWMLVAPEDATMESVLIEDCVAQSAQDCHIDGALHDSDPAPGSLTVTGLAPVVGQYSLIEERAPSGYRLDQTPHSFSITTQALDHRIAEPIVNEKSAVPQIPFTGGRSAQMFLLAGAGLAGLAALAMVADRLRRRRVTVPVRSRTHGSTASTQARKEHRR